MMISVPDQELRLITILDPHLSWHTPVSRKDDYWITCKETLYSIIDFADKNKVHAILIAGDIFHLKPALRNPPAFITEILEILTSIRTRGIRVLVIAGNHDITFSNKETIRTQPIGVLVASGLVTLLDSEEVFFNLSDIKVRVIGESYGHNAVDILLSKRKLSEDVLIALGHFWFGSQTGEFFGEPVHGPDKLSLSDIDIWVIGHHHADMGIVRENNKLYVVHGSMSRTGSHEDDLTRRPAVGLLRVSKQGTKASIIRLKTRPAEELFDLEVRKQVMEEKKALDIFLDSLKESLVKEKEWTEIYKTLPLSIEVRSAVDEAVQKADHSLRKDI